MKTFRQSLFRLMYRWFIIALFFLGKSFVGAIEVEKKGVFLDTLTMQSDYNLNGSADIFEDYNANGFIDLFEDFNFNGHSDSFEDFNCNGLPDAFEDVNQNKIADSYEDCNANGVPDGFEDLDANGIPDVYELRYEFGGEKAALKYFGVMGVTVCSASNLDKSLMSNKIYHGSVYRLLWINYLSKHMDLNGVVYRVDNNPNGRVGMDAGAYVGRGTDFGEVTLPEQGCYYVHLVPVKNKSRGVDQNAKTTVLIRRDNRGPRVHSLTHPCEDEWYASHTVSLELLPFHLDSKSIAGFYFTWDQEPNTVPTKESAFTESFRTSYDNVSDGVYFFHVRSMDLVGSLSQTSHFTVRVGDRPRPVADFAVSKESGSAPLTVKFKNLSHNEISAYVWDFDNDGTVDSNEADPIHTFYYPGVYSVKLMVIGLGGISEEMKTDLIEVIP